MTYTGYKNKSAAFISMARRYWRDTEAAIIFMFALMAPVVIGAAGMALDYAQAYLVQQRLAQAVDAAALAAAATSSDPEIIEQKVRQFFDANYPPEKLGATFDPIVVVDGDQVRVTGNARYHTRFLRVIGVDEIDVDANTTVQREVQGLEVVLVLDNTGSMATNDNISALKTATKSFINILFDSTDNPNNIKIGMVPYSNTVRVGRYGLGQNPDGTPYADEDVFVTLPAGVNYTNTRNSYDWYGCVVEHKDEGYLYNATHVANSRGQLWDDGTGDYDGHGWDPKSGSNDPYDYDVLDEYEGPWDIYAFGRVVAKGTSYSSKRCSDFGGNYNNTRCSKCDKSYSSNGNTRTGFCSSQYCFCYQASSNGGTNIGCPQAYIRPLISDQEELLAHVDTMNTDGNTLGNIGMAWGARLISPEAPFEEAAEWDNEYWRKAVIMMTDGDKTLNGTYSSYWMTDKHDITVTNLNERFEETCEALKEQGVTIYTVTFTSAINDDTKGYYERCASSEDQYFDAPTQEELLAVFEQISRELSQLYIKN